MIIKQGNDWIVKDSSGKKVLGRHKTKEKARKQLAAIEISKKKNLEENIKLIEKKNNLMREILNILEQMGSDNIPNQNPINSKGRYKIKKVEENLPPAERYLEAKPFHGLASHGKGALAQQDILQKYYDNPETPEIEQADETNWQNVNTAVSNYVGDQVNQLMRQQRMLG